MEITRYRFGEIEIDGRTYTADLIGAIKPFQTPFYGLPDRGR